MAHQSPQRMRASPPCARPPVVTQGEHESAEQAVARLSRELQEERALAAKQQTMLADMKDRMERLASATEAEEEKLTSKVRRKPLQGLLGFRNIPEAWPKRLPASIARPAAQGNSAGLAVGGVSGAEEPWRTVGCAGRSMSQQHASVLEECLLNLTAPPLPSRPLRVMLLASSVPASLPRS